MMNDDAERKKLHERIQKHFEKPECSKRLDDFYSKPVKSFKDKFFLINLPKEFNLQARVLLDYLSTIHNYFTEDRFLVWYEKSKKMEAKGQYFDYRYIRINAKDTQKLISLTHEIGHVIDVFEINFRTFQKEDLKPIRSAYKQLIKKLSVNSLTNGIHELKESDQINPIIIPLLEYSGSAIELFARSYVFYIYQKLSSELKNQWEKGFKIETPFQALSAEYSNQYFELCDNENIGYSPNLHWEDRNEFKDLEKAWDKLIKSFKCYKILEYYTE
jgi:hypothetical protein